MPSGGARSRSGPPPYPGALRRDREGAWTVLPAEGRAGDPPAWPLEGQSAREAVLWADFWSRPQATQWETSRQEYEVALYVRNLARAELPGALVNLSILVARQADALGLTLPGLARNRWRIADSKSKPGAEGGESTPAPAAPTRPSARSRFTLINGEAA